MKLLIVTQVIDIDHPILGFFHRWVIEFAANCEHVHVICLQAGRHSLPANVTVHSLGKESGAGRLHYLWRFYKLIWSLRHEYDHVFVHMNQVYVILGGLLWRTWGKRVGLWYMHGTTSPSLRLAEKLTHYIFTGSPESCRLRSQKIIVTGHGIDTDTFSPTEQTEKDISAITVGRITQSKNLSQLLEIWQAVYEQTGAQLTIVGAAVTDAEKEYEQQLQQQVKDLQLQDAVNFYGRVDQASLPALLNRAKVFVTVAQNGSLDKVVLEAMACGVPVVSMAPGVQSLRSIIKPQNKHDFISNCLSMLESGHVQSSAERDEVSSDHALSALVKNKILAQYE